MRARNDMATASTSQQSLDPGVVRMAADVLAHLSDPTRLHLLALLADQQQSEQDVTGLAAQVSASRSSVSQHLGRLRLAGLVTARREGRHMLYRITSDHLSRLVEEALQFAGHAVRGIPHHHDEQA
jgi:DNA-binding transcriptional ArsR family regulator